MARDERAPLCVELGPMKPRGPLTVVLVCVLPVVLWATFGPPQPFTGSYATLTSLGVIAGISAAAAVACNLILGARFRVVDAYFGGLDKMFAFHRRLGEVAVGLLVCHALLIVSSRAVIAPSAGLALFSPAAGIVVLAGVAALAIAGVTSSSLSSRGWDTKSSFTFTGSSASRSRSPHFTSWDRLERR